MQRVGDIMADLGFNEDAPEGAQRAFIKNLIREAYGAEVKQLSDFRKNKNSKFEAEKVTSEAKTKKVSGSPEQMSFNFEEE